jgi:hypothetical protein
VLLVIRAASQTSAFYILTDSFGPVKLKEHCFHQEPSVRLFDQDGIILDSRKGLEHRTFEEGESTLWPVRNLVQLRVPISANNKLVAYIKPFIELNETDIQGGGLSVWQSIK